MEATTGGELGYVIAAIFLAVVGVGWFAGRDYQRQRVAPFLRGVYGCCDCCARHGAVAQDLLSAWGMELREPKPVSGRKFGGSLVLALLLPAAAAGQGIPLKAEGPASGVSDASARADKDASPSAVSGASDRSDKDALLSPSRWEYATWAGLSGAAHWAVQRDVSSTQRALRLCPSCFERTGFARPFVGSHAKHASAAHAATAGVNALSLWMLKSKRQPWRQMWWIPQVALAVVPHVFAERNNRLVRDLRGEARR